MDKKIQDISFNAIPTDGIHPWTSDDPLVFGTVTVNKGQGYVNYTTLSMEH